MPLENLKEREEALQTFLKKIDADIETFSTKADQLRARHEELQGIVRAAGLEPVPIAFSVGKSMDVLKELENHVMELNKLKNLVSMKLKQLLQEDDLLAHLQAAVGEGVSVHRTARGAVELEVADPQAKESLALLESSKKKMDELKAQIHELGETP